MVRCRHGFNGNCRLFVLKEAMTAKMMIGLIFVITGVILLNRSKSQKLKIKRPGADRLNSSSAGSFYFNLKLHLHVSLDRS